jgi:hypothetical protein
MNKISIRELPKPFKNINVASLIKLKPSQIEYPKSAVQSKQQYLSSPTKQEQQKTCKKAIGLNAETSSFVINTDFDAIYNNTVSSLRPISTKGKIFDFSGTNILIHKIKTRNTDHIIDPLTMDSFNRSGEHFGLQNFKFEYFNNTAVNKIKAKFPLIVNRKKQDSKMRNNYYSNNIKMKFIKSLHKNSIE